MSIGFIGAIIIGASMIIGAISHKILKKKDNIVEQIAEQIIEEQTGIEIDFTPEEKDKPKKEDSKDIEEKK